MTDDEPLYFDLPPPSTQRITEIHVWIATYPNGSEGIVSADMPMPDGLGMRHVPLLSSKREIAELLEGTAHKVRRAAMHQAYRIVKLRLVTFKVTEGE